MDYSWDSCFIYNVCCPIISAIDYKVAVEVLVPFTKKLDWNIVRQTSVETEFTIDVV